MIKIFRRDGKEGRERRKRIEESRDAIICIRSFYPEFYKARLVPVDEFKKEDYLDEDTLITNIYGDMYLVMFNCPLTVPEFVEYFRDRDIFIAKKYEDLDGKLAQSHFELY